MDVHVEHRPSYALAVVRLDPGETVRAESGAMVAMRDATIQTTTGGGLGKALKRSLLGGESFWQNTFTAGPKGGEVHLAPPLPGDITVVDLAGTSVIVQDTSYLASATTVDLDTKWQGLRGAAAGEGFVLLRASGTGKLLLTSYGAIVQRTLAPGESFTVDTGHIVAFTEGMGYTPKRVGGLKSTLLSGEGLVVECTGPGTLWMQTRSVQAFLGWLLPRLPQRQA